MSVTKSFKSRGRLTERLVLLRPLGSASPVVVALDPDITVCPVWLWPRDNLVTFSIFDIFDFLWRCWPHITFALPIRSIFHELFHHMFNLVQSLQVYDVIPWIQDCFENVDLNLYKFVLWKYTLAWISWRKIRMSAGKFQPVIADSICRLYSDL